MQSLRTALRVLGQFSQEKQAFGVVELAQGTGLSKSHVSKLLAEFVRGGLLRQDPQTRLFSVDVRLFVIGSRFSNYDQLSKEALPILRQLVEETGHTARVSVMVGERAVSLVVVEGPLFEDTGCRAGMSLPTNSAAGKVLLAFMQSKEAERLTRPGGRRHPAAAPPASPPLTGLPRIRSQGYATHRGEANPHLSALGVPIFGVDQHAIGALTIALPGKLLSGKTEAGLAELLHDAARKISGRMGCVFYRFGRMPRTRPVSRLSLVQQEFRERTGNVAAGETDDATQAPASRFRLAARKR